MELCVSSGVSRAAEGLLYLTSPFSSCPASSFVSLPFRSTFPFLGLSSPGSPPSTELLVMLLLGSVVFFFFSLFFSDHWLF